MSASLDAFAIELQENGLRYTKENENCISIKIIGNHINCTVFFYFDEDNDDFVTLKCWDFVNVRSEDRMRVIFACNELNKKYKWIKFYVDNDGDAIAECDAEIDYVTGEKECYHLLQRIVAIMDEAALFFRQFLYVKGMPRNIF